MPGGELQLQMLRNLSQAPSSFENQLYFYKTESLDYLLKAGSYKDFFPLEKRLKKKKTEFPFEMSVDEMNTRAFHLWNYFWKQAQRSLSVLLLRIFFYKLFSCWLL